MREHTEGWPCGGQIKCPACCAETNTSAYWVGAKPPYSVTYIDPKVCATSTDQWFVMGTVDGDPRNGQGPVAICEYEPSAHTIARLLNANVPVDSPARD